MRVFTCRIFFRIPSCENSAQQTHKANRTASQLLSTRSLPQSGFTDKFFEQIKGAGDYVVHDYVEADGFFIDKKHIDKNYVYLPPLNVSGEFKFLSGIAGLRPSPDWYTGFYLFETVKLEGGTFWDSFKIRTYPWDAGTDDGTHYDDPDRDTNPPGVVTRIEVGNTVDNIFLSPAGDELRYLVEWECVLHTCPENQPLCEKADWPPANGCDVLKYPECAEVCDPETMDCEQCRRESESEGKIFYKDCCLAGRVPKDGRKCEGEESSGASLAFVAAWTAVVLGMVALF